MTANKKVLIIDNSEPTFFHINISQLLAKEGYETDILRNPEAGLQRLNNRDYDLIVVQEGPEAESWQLCNGIRQISGKPLIFIRRDASADTCVRTINAGADYFLRKSFGPLEFLARVQCLLQRRAVKQPLPIGM